MNESFIVLSSFKIFFWYENDWILHLNNHIVISYCLKSQKIRTFEIVWKKLSYITAGAFNERKMLFAIDIHLNQYKGNVCRFPFNINLIKQSQEYSDKDLVANFWKPFVLMESQQVRKIY